VRLILIPFFNQLTVEEKGYWHFMQDSSTIHTANSLWMSLLELSVND
jgi:hypothetical protein